MATKEEKLILDTYKVGEFYDYLIENQKLSRKKALYIISYLQSELPIISNNIHQCWNCRSFFNENSEGTLWAKKGQFYCGPCSYCVPEGAEFD